MRGLRRPFLFLLAAGLCAGVCAASGPEAERESAAALFDGSGISSWIDTAQINYSSQALRDRMTAIVKGWVTKLDVDGFRVVQFHRVGQCLRDTELREQGRVYP